MIVLQALGINSQTKSPSAKQNEAKSHANELASQVKDSLQSSVKTPSPTSRLSSGFGSLLDEDGIMTMSCESSHSEDPLKVGRHVQSSSPQVAINTPLPIEQVTSVKEQLKEQRKYHKEQKHKSRRNHRGEKVRSPSDSQLPHQDAFTSHIHLKSPNSNMSGMKSSEQIKDSVSPIQSDHSPRLRGRAWVSPVASPATSSDKSASYTQTPLAPSQIQDPFESRNSTRSNQTGVMSAKPLSPRKEKAVHKLVEKQIELERSRNERIKLVTEVQLLDLHVEEEKTK